MGFLTLFLVYFISSEKATKFCDILSYVVPVKSKVEMSQIIVASEYMNFKSV